MSDSSFAPFLPVTPAGDGIKAEAKRAFLELCGRGTQNIHTPIADLQQVRGHLNPAGLGQAEEFSRQGSLGQSSVGYESLEAYHEADKRGRSPAYGGAEYGVVQTPEAEAVCRKMAALHNGTGAVICPSGLSAITTTLNAFEPKIILIPENVYAPVVRYLNRRGLETVRYPARASVAEFKAALDQARSTHKPGDILTYIEAPGSGTFEIPDIRGIAYVSRANGVRTAMDNTYASHVRFKPLDHGIGIDIAIQATTKYEGGYGDTPSGVVIAASEADLGKLKYELRASGNGTVAPTTCARLFNRIDSAAERLDRHYETAQALMNWFRKQDSVDDILCPALESSPDHARFLDYFGKGNGLFSVRFRENVASENVHAFLNRLNLFVPAESWGGHVSLVLPVGGHGAAATATTIRFHAGLEDANDLLRDLEQARPALTMSVPTAPGRQKSPQAGAESRTSPPL